MSGLTWIQVLEIETYLNRLIENSAIGFQVMLWQEGTRYSLLLNKSQIYSPKDIEQYLFNKYPNNEFIRKNPEIIKRLL